MTKAAATVRTYSAGEFDVGRLVAAKAGRTVSVCLPARDEAATVGDIVATIRSSLVDRPGGPLVDEILVVDDGSRDATMARAQAAGATALRAADVLPECGPGTGKGEALWKSLAASTGDLVVWCDADVRRFDPAFVTGLLGPLLTDPAVRFVKGCYRRPLGAGGDGGGRVTELVAKPVLALLFPHLAAFAQPLSGEYGGRRDLLERLPFEQGYGVDLGLLVDVAAVSGPGALAQVDLGERVHRNRPLGELTPQATAVLRAALSRAGAAVAGGPVVVAPAGSGPVAVDDGRRPPLVEVRGYRRRAS